MGRRGLWIVCCLVFPNDSRNGKLRLSNPAKVVRLLVGSCGAYSIVQAVRVSRVCQETNMTRTHRCLISCFTSNIIQASCAGIVF